MYLAPHKYTTQRIKCRKEGSYTGPEVTHRFTPHGWVRGTSTYSWSGSYAASTSRRRKIVTYKEDLKKKSFIAYSTSPRYFRTFSPYVQADVQAKR
ncbi:hypothetical protein KP509_18G035800 [Ceratopteris richardii]|uniref:Uncharacterized protein n=1 Tax=Ceratopteris richardii TaxID=49495 RepID=A0A8T2SSG2_CERRI|nr:hypothetical protein KP509_18G035800 [Ceratopteris richardii]